MFGRRPPPPAGVHERLVAALRPALASLAAHPAAASATAVASRAAATAAAALAPANAALARHPPLAVAAVAAVALHALLALLAHVRARVRHRGGVQQVVLDVVKRAPFISGYVASETAKAEARLRASLPPRPPSLPPLLALPASGSSPAAVLAALGAAQTGDALTPASVGGAGGGVPRPNRVSGALYLPPGPAGADHAALVAAAAAAYAHANPMHASVFPSAVALERDVVAMTAAMLHGEVGAAPHSVRGSITSGGTESILLAVLAAREHAARARGVVGGGEIVLAPSAHAAFNKAAHYFGLTLRPVPPRAPGGALHGPDVARALSRRTVLVVASAVSFPHGVLDDVAGVAAAAAARGVPCHVDACLGGFVLPFVEDAGRPPLPAWDFRVPGVTSMSVDLHKYAQSPKGASVVLFRGAALRKAAFVATTDWPGGLYVSPSLAGSRSASVVAASWAALVYNGRAGLAAAARGVLREASKFEAGLASIPELAVVGAPASSVVAFGPSPAGRAAGLNIYVLNDALSAQGWHLNALQRPPALHMCFTAQHTGGGADALLADLRAAVGKAVGGAGKDEGTAPIYGQAGTTPDRGIIRDFLETYQDVLLTG